MKTVLGLVLCLGLGVLVTVAVAWTHALTIDPFQDVRQGEDATETDYWQLTRWGRPGAVVVRSTHNPQYRGTRYRGGVPMDEFRPAWLSALHPEGAYLLDRRTVEARGWPMVAWCSVRDVHTARAGEPMVSVDLEDGVATQLTAWTYGGPAHVRAIPLRPLWTGLAVDSLAYGGILWLLFAAPFGLRRVMRRRRGRCEHCGYPLGESPQCPECGRQKR